MKLLIQFVRVADDLSSAVKPAANDDHVPNVWLCVKPLTHLVNSTGYVLILNIKPKVLN